jgi:hypothetical protein
MEILEKRKRGFLERRKVFERDHLDRLLDEGHEGKLAYFEDGEIKELVVSYQDLRQRMSSDPAFSVDNIMKVEKPKVRHLRHRSRPPM